MGSTESPENQNQPNQPSSAKDFQSRAKERTDGKLITLPSGLSVVCKRPSVSALIRSGVIPSHLASSIQESAKNENQTADLSRAVELNDIVVINSVVSPKVVKENANYEAGEVNVDDFEDNDKAAITQYVEGGVKALESFRN